MTQFTDTQKAYSAARSKL